MSLSKIPALKLPLVAFESIYQNLSITDIIDLSLCSRRARELCQKMEKSRKNVFVQVEMSRNWAQVELSHDERGKFQWNWYSKRNLELISIEKFINRRFDNKNWKFGLKNDHHWVTSDENQVEFEDTVLFMFQYFTDLFQRPIDLAYIKLQRRMSFKKLFQDTNLLHTVTEIISIGECCVEPWEMSFLLDNLKTKWLKLGTQPGDHYDYQKPISYLGLKLDCAYWLTEQQFFEMVWKSVTMTLYETVLTEDARILKRFLMEWWEGDNDLLQMIDITGRAKYRKSEDWMPLTYSNLLEGIPHSGGAQKDEKASQFYMRHWQYENGRDFRRKDGKLATIIVYQDDHSSYFSFTVWNCENPNKTQ